ncbi:uncharacterized protein LOC131878297 [Tigriopus californicus]|uniref:uncharacterized protein LOC131878297 n=1 Tax=Tigriopus californicus TaxID=6832 RepID=UPI0027D9FD8B|nr:uncharacterized protein LOC131878297 [Tigriopus californicus]
MKEQRSRLCDHWIENDHRGQTFERTPAGVPTYHISRRDITMATRIQEPTEAHPRTDGNSRNPGGTVRGTPDPPRFDHLVHADNDRMEALDSWVDGFEAYCEAFYGNEDAPAEGDVVSNNQWKRLLRIALAPATTSLVRNKFPNLKDNSVTYIAIIDLLRQQFGNLRSEFATMNALLDSHQKVGEAFSAFHGRISSLAARSGFSCNQCRGHLVRHLALRSTTCTTIRAAALQNKWTGEELPVRAREVEISTAAATVGRKIPTLRVDLEEEDDSQEQEEVYRIGGP